MDLLVCQSLLSIRTAFRFNKTRRGGFCWEPPIVAGLRTGDTPTRGILSRLLISSPHYCIDRQHPKTLITKSPARARRCRRSEEINCTSAYVTVFNPSEGYNPLYENLVFTDIEIMLRKFYRGMYSSIYLSLTGACRVGRLLIFSAVE